MPQPSPEEMRILAELENGIPLETRPFAGVAGNLGMTEAHLVERVRALLETGALRRLAVLFDSRAMGFATTLVAARTRREDSDKAVALIGGFNEVTHCYRRSGSRFDIWFTLTAPGRGRIDSIITELRRSGHFTEVIELPTEKVYKLRVRMLDGAGECDG